MRYASFSFALIFLLCCGGCNGSRPANLSVDSGIEAELRQVKAIDNHAHPVRVVSAGEADRDYDALPGDALDEVPLPGPIRLDSYYFPAAWKALFNYTYSDATPEHVRGLTQAKAEMVRQKGDLYPAWVLNHANTELMLANRVAMGRGLSNDRFKWVPYADMFLLPLSNEALKARDADHKAFIGAEEILLHRYLAAENMKAVPGNFDDYLTFVSHMLEMWKANGAVAFKFEFAYLRDLRIGSAQKENAERVYAIYSRSSEPTAEEYKLLQDFLFRYISTEAGRLDVPVHIHTSLGIGSYFQAAGANPLALEPLFNDPALRRTKFVMLHAGWPFVREAKALLLKPNVYLDFSLISFLEYPMDEARDLRSLIEFAPEKVLYGSDASPLSNTVGWEETAWIASNNARLALGVALTGMTQDGEITIDRAKEIAHMVMRENARQLYRF